MKKFLRYLITAGVGLALVILIVGLKGAFGGVEVTEAMKIWCDGFFASGVVFVCVGVIVMASNGGAFDMLAYSVRLIFELLRRDLKTRKYKDYYEYRKAKSENKRSFAFLLIVGLALVAISVIFLILFYKL